MITIEHRYNDWYKMLVDDDDDDDEGDGDDDESRFSGYTSKSQSVLAKSPLDIPSAKST